MNYTKRLAGLIIGTCVLAWAYVFTTYFGYLMIKEGSDIAGVAMILTNLVMFVCALFVGITAYRYHIDRGL